ncbi:MAG TPA: CHAD domain-containing protein [Bryobacteraceae bacterium]|nr:CHAD domain-containing protein [Bryobacteraceae bacterium]
MHEFVLRQTANLLDRFAHEVKRSAKSDDADAVHDLRVAIRRLSRCLSVFSEFYPKRPWKKIRRQLDDLRDLAGAARDQHIALELLAESGVGEGTLIVAYIQAERRKATRELASEIERLQACGFSRKWRASLGLPHASS